MDPRADQFWNLYLRSLPQTPFPAKRYYETFHFGNSERLADECADLVRQGVKTATSALLWEYEAKGKAPPQAGDLSIVTNWNGEPLCVIETIEVTIVPFRAVDEQFVADYGEGDRSMNWWQTNIWEIILKNARSSAERQPRICLSSASVFESSFTGKINVALASLFRRATSPQAARSPHRVPRRGTKSPARD